MGRTAQLQPGVGTALPDRLAYASGASNAEVVGLLGVSWPTVTKWRARFVAPPARAWPTRPGLGAARRISDEQVERALVTALESTRNDAT